MNFKEYIPFYKRNLAVAVPVMLTQAGQITVHMADNIMVGHLGTTELASVSFANSIYILGMVFGIGFTQGLTPHVGQTFGKGDHSSVSALLKNSLILNLSVSLLLTMVMFGVGTLMGYMGQTEAVVSNGREYYNIILFGLVPFLMFFGLRQFSEGIGITKYAMYITLFANFLNILLNWILIYGHMGFEAMGIKGAATATFISRVVMLTLFVIVMFRNECYNKYLKLIRWPLVDLSRAKMVLKTSVPLSFQNLVEITAFSMSAVMIGWLGETQLASHQIAMSMSSFSFMLALGVGAAATIRVSHQLGYGDFRSMRIAGFAAIHLSVFLMALCGLAYIIFREQIPYIFSEDPAVRSLAATLLIVSALFQIFDATQLASLACLRALADVKVPLVLSIISYYLISLPMGYFCGFILGFGTVGVWVGLLAGLGFAAVLFLLRFSKISNRMIAENS